MAMAGCWGAGYRPRRGGGITPLAPCCEQALTLGLYSEASLRKPALPLTLSVPCPVTQFPHPVCYVLHSNHGVFGAGLSLPVSQGPVSHWCCCRVNKAPGLIGWAQHSPQRETASPFSPQPR